MRTVAVWRVEIKVPEDWDEARLRQFMEDDLPWLHTGVIHAAVIGAEPFGAEAEVKEV